MTLQNVTTQRKILYQNSFIEPGYFLLYNIVSYFSAAFLAIILRNDYQVTAAVQPQATCSCHLAHVYCDILSPGRRMQKGNILTNQS